LRRAADSEEDGHGHRHGEADDDAEIFHATLLVGAQTITGAATCSIVTRSTVRRG
jgi:hypothetical protein